MLMDNVIVILGLTRVYTHLKMLIKEVKVNFRYGISYQTHFSVQVKEHI